MVLILVFIPLVSCFSCLGFGRFFGGLGCSIITSVSIFSSLWLASYNLKSTVFLNGLLKMQFIPWIEFEDLKIFFSFCIDNLSGSMLMVILLVSFCVHLYSIEYMSGDPHRGRFMSYLTLFTFFMLVLVCGSNLLVLFIGWEGVGLCSFLLINFWFTRLQANKAAIKAVVINRIGDLFIVLGMLLILFSVANLEYDTLFSSSPLLKRVSFFGISVSTIKVLDLICICLFFGAVGKSAQIGLHTWLPDAMEGPTPVSALIHAATMVTAGVFLIIRSSFLFEFSQNVLVLIMLCGGFTAIFAAVSGLFQNDIKRIIAYSTCSQLGYMIFACGISNYNISFYHLANHAFFKALLFLAAGAVIHAIADEQDIRKMGGFKNLLPIIFVLFFIGSLALVGFPFLSGFYSKDIILESTAAQFKNTSLFIYCLGIVGAFATTFYSVRLLLLTFFNKTRSTKLLVTSIHECDIYIFIALVILAICSIFHGYITNDFYANLGSFFWNKGIFLLPMNNIIFDIEFINFNKGFPFISMSLGFIVSFLYCYKFSIETFYKRKFNKNFFNMVYNFFIKKWYFDRLYNEQISQSILLSSRYYFYNNIERGILETLGPKGIDTFISYVTYILKSFQTGFIMHYLIYFLIIVPYLFTKGYSITLLVEITFMGMLFVYLREDMLKINSL